MTIPPCRCWNDWSKRALCMGLALQGFALAAEKPEPFTTQAWHDLGAYVQAPLSFDNRDWTTAALWVGGLGLGMQADHRVGGWIADRPSSLQDDLGKTFEPFGQSASFVVLAGFAAQGYWGNDPRAMRTAQEGLEVSLLGAGLAVTSLKYAIGRPRPNDAGFGADPKFFSGNKSFPSGHPAQAFGIATVIAGNYGDDYAWVPYVAYGTATLVGWQRVYGKHHNPTDVIAGAAIGYYTAKWVMKRHRARAEADATALEFSPSLQLDGILLSARRSF